MKHVIQIAMSVDELENLVSQAIRKAIPELEPPPEYLTEAETCELLKISPKVLRGMRQRREVKTYYLGKSPRFNREDILRDINNSK